MGSGLGSTQRAICDLFDSNPGRRFTVAQVTAHIYPGEPITRSRTNAVGLALRRLTPTLGLTRCRVASSGPLGWHHLWGKSK